jgi:hypothetical protein
MLLPVAQILPGAVKGQNFPGGSVGENVTVMDVDRGEGRAGRCINALFSGRSNRRAIAERQK